MERLIYSSCRGDDTDNTGYSPDFRAIVAVASRLNKRHGVTGFLVCASQWYAQVLEGSADKLDRLMDNIMRDRRHFQVRILERLACSARAFPDWSMGWQHQNIANRIVFLEYGLAQDLPPSPTQSDDVMQLALKLSELGPPKLPTRRIEKDRASA